MAADPPMTLVWHDSPDYYTTALLGRFFSFAHADATVTSGGYGGGDAYSGSSIDAYLLQHLSAVVDSGDPRFGCGGRFRVSAAPASEVMVLAIVDETGAVQVSVTLDDALLMHIWRGDPATGALLVSAASAILTDTDYRVGFRGRVSVATGEAELFIDGASVALVTAVNTADTGVGTWSGLYLGTPDGVLWSHVYVGMGAGALRPGYLVRQLTPTADVVAQWVATPASDNYEAIDEAVADDETSYLDAQLTGDQFAVTVSTMPAASAVYGVRTVAIVKNTDGSRTSFRLLLRDATGRESLADAMAISDTDWVSVSRFDRVNPHTSLAWTPASINVTAFGGVAR